MSFPPISLIINLLYSWLQYRPLKINKSNTKVMITSKKNKFSISDIPNLASKQIDRQACAHTHTNQVLQPSSMQ